MNMERVRASVWAALEAMVNVVDILEVGASPDVCIQKIEALRNQCLDNMQEPGQVDQFLHYDRALDALYLDSTKYAAILSV